METLGFLTLCLVLGVCYGINTYDLPAYGLLSLVNSDLDEDWMIFKKSYNRSYADSDEELRRRLYWEDTLKFIEDHNYKYDQGIVSYTVGENSFADMAEDEFEDIYMHGVVLPEVPEEYPEPLTEPNLDLPSSIDWRNQGLVSSVKNQGQCGSCWAFSALGALEGQVKKSTGRMLDLSEQNLVDCCRGKWQSWGCRGGWMNNAFNYIRDNRGIDNEYCYRYEARDNRCRYRSSCRATSDRGSENVGRSEYSLQQAVADIGPISIAMDVNSRGFWSYRRGIFNEPRCNKNRPTHAMLCAGYGTQYGDFWLIKNSWGTGWGDRGYFKLARNRGDTCGVSLYASYPTV